MKALGILGNRKKTSVRHFVNGKIYFSRTAEQRFFFALTVIMLLAGFLYKLGVLH